MAPSARVILDRLSQLLPTWGATSEADIGIALAELLAYLGDSLSYKQDAVATEAYLQTARSRISLRRHALLVDYHVHDGCNARTWVHLEVSVAIAPRRHEDTVLHQGRRARRLRSPGNERQALAAGVVIFEGMQDGAALPGTQPDVVLHLGRRQLLSAEGRNRGDAVRQLKNLQPGDVLIFEEIVGPQTGNPADADVRHRCAVRLTRVTTQDAQGNPLVDPLFEDGTGKPITSAGQKPTPVTEIQWSTADALPFPVYVSRASTSTRSRKSRSFPRSASCSATICWPITASRLTGVRLGTSAAAQALPSAESRRRPLQSDGAGPAAGALSARHTR